MNYRPTHGLLRRLGLNWVGSPRRGRRIRPTVEDRSLTIESPRRAWLFGPELRPKTVPLRRLG